MNVPAGMWAAPAPWPDPGPLAEATCLIPSNPPSSTMVHHTPPWCTNGAPGSTIASALSLCSAGSIIEPQRFWRINNTLTVGDVPQNNYFHHKKINEGSKLGSFSSFSASPASTLLGIELWWIFSGLDKHVLSLIQIQHVFH